MDPSQEEQQAMRGLEIWLRSWPRRLVLIAVAVVVATIVTTFQLYELFEEFAERRLELTGFRPEFEWLAAGQHQLLSWGLWGVAAEGIVWVSRSLSRAVGHWALIVLLQLPLSYGVAVGSIELNDWLSQILFDDREPGALPLEPRPEGRPGGPLGPRRTRPEEELGRPGRNGALRRGRMGDRGPQRGLHFFLRSRKYRMPREMGTYWVILALGAGIASYLRSQTQERAASTTQLNNANLQTRLARAQMNSLRSQLQPHFLFNALHTVGGLIRSGEDALALKTLSALGGLLRKTLDLGESQRVLLSEELEIAERYLAIEKIRFGERLVTVVDSSNEALETKVPALVLLPLVENAVRYGVEPRVEGGRVEVEAIVIANRLRLEVRDDGPGFSTEVMAGSPQEDGRAHIGLANTRRRLEMLYGSEHQFTLENDPEGGACVWIEIPIEREGVRG